MLYFDHAATSYPKSLSVQRAVSQAMTVYGANPGRGGYPMSINTAQMLHRCRIAAARVFGVEDERQVIFTPSCTHALNIVIKTFTAGGGHVLVSDREHNAVMRPLYAVSPRYPVFETAAVVTGDAQATVASFRRAVTPRTRAIVCTHASNVTGEVLPIAALARLAHEHGIPLVVDAAQSAGHLPIDMTRDGIDYLCTAGHKGLGGPMGTGLLVCAGETTLATLIEGGTGSHSASFAQPTELPEHLESGTPNVAGIAGLLAGLERLEKIGVSRIEEHEHRLAVMLYDALSHIDGVRLYSAHPRLHDSTGVLSLTVDGMTPDAVAEALAERGIAVRAGLHCAPAAHRCLGTLPLGTVRLSVGAANSAEQVQKLVQNFKKIVPNPLQFVGGI